MGQKCFKIHTSGKSKRNSIHVSSHPDAMNRRQKRKQERDTRRQKERRGVWFMFNAENYGERMAYVETEKDEGTE